MKLTLGQIYRISIAATAVVAGALAAFGIYFLYAYAYRTVTQTEYIVTLQREYAVEAFKFQEFSQLVNANRARKAAPPPDWTSANDPFRNY